MRVFVACFIWVASVPAFAQLTPEAVRESVRAHHPAIASALARQRAADADLLASRGAFDPELAAEGSIRTGDGYYEYRRANVELRQATPLWGTEVYAGWRYGVGEDDRWPSYDSRETANRGEVRAGVRIPIWRNGPMDARRAGRARAEHRLDAAEHRRFATELTLEQQAISAYWSWVAAGRRLAVAIELRELAQTRRDQVQARVASGALPEVEALEAERSALQRESSWVAARRGVESAALDLSLFLRNEASEPRLPADTELPSEIVLPSEPSAGMGAQAAQCHPDVLAMERDIDAEQVSRDLARAQLAPQVDVRLQVSRDLGTGNETLEGTVVEGTLQVGLPLGFRRARGDLEAARARIADRRERKRLRSDQLSMAAADIVSAYRAARERYQLALRLEETTRQLAEAERTRFEAGATTLLVVNLREQSLAQAAVGVATAAELLWLARAEWDALTACAR